MREKMAQAFGTRIVMDIDNYAIIKAYCQENGLVLANYIGFILSREADRIKNEER